VNNLGFKDYDHLINFVEAFSLTPRFQRLNLSGSEAKIPAKPFLSLTTNTFLTIIRGDGGFLPQVDERLNIIEAVLSLKSFKYSGLEIFSYQAKDFSHWRKLLDLQDVDMVVPECGLDILHHIRPTKVILFGSMGRGGYMILSM